MLNKISKILQEIERGFKMWGLFLTLNSDNRIDAHYSYLLDVDNFHIEKLELVEGNCYCIVSYHNGKKYFLIGCFYDHEWKALKAFNKIHELVQPNLPQFDPDFNGF